MWSLNFVCLRGKRAVKRVEDSNEVDGNGVCMGFGRLGAGMDALGNVYNADIGLSGALNGE